MYSTIHCFIFMLSIIVAECQIPGESTFGSWVERSPYETDVRRAAFAAVTQSSPGNVLLEVVRAQSAVRFRSL